MEEKDPSMIGNSTKRGEGMLIRGRIDKNGLKDHGSADRHDGQADFCVLVGGSRTRTKTW